MEHLEQIPVDDSDVDSCVSDSSEEEDDSKSASSQFVAYH